MKITPQQAAKLKDANLGNLVKKLKSGKTLTAAESKMIDEASAGEDDESVALCTLNKICDLFAITRKTVAEWRRNGRVGVPEKFGEKENLTAWREFFGKYPEAGFSDGKPRKDRETLLCHKLEIDIALKQITLDQLNGQMVSRAECAEAWTRVGCAVAAMLRVVESEIPRACLGLPIHKALPIAKAKMAAIQKTFADAESAFWKTHPENPDAKP